MRMQCSGARNFARSWPLTNHTQLALGVFGVENGLGAGLPINRYRNGCANCKTAQIIEYTGLERFGSVTLHLVCV